MGTMFADKASAKWPFEYEEIDDFHRLLIMINDIFFILLKLVQIYFP